MGRPKTHKNAAARQAAFRAVNRRLELTVSTELGATIDGLAVYLDTTKNALVTAMLKYALTNRNWRINGVWLDKK